METAASEGSSGRLDLTSCAILSTRSRSPTRGSKRGRKKSSTGSSSSRNSKSSGSTRRRLGEGPYHTPSPPLSPPPLWQQIKWETRRKKRNAWCSLAGLFVKRPKRRSPSPRRSRSPSPRRLSRADSQTKLRVKRKKTGFKFFPCMSAAKKAVQNTEKAMVKKAAKGARNVGKKIWFPFQFGWKAGRKIERKIESIGNKTGREIETIGKKTGRGIGKIAWAPFKFGINAEKKLFKGKIKRT